MYPIHRFDVNSVTLSKSPLDDYQRLYFGTLLSYSQERQPNVDIKSVSYKSNVAELFRQDVRNGMQQNGMSLDSATGARLNISSGILSGVVQTESQDNMEDSLTKNQQFKLRKLGHSMQSRLINPNNCVLWTHDSGYRLYQDVMRGLSSLPRIGENQRNAAEMCREELEFITTKAFYDGHSLERRRRRHSSGGELDQNTNKQGGPAAYSDLHWNGISRDLKRQLVETYRNHLIHSGVPFAEASKVSLSDVMQRIRGGYIKIQGTWLPLDMAKLILPIFGPDFPQLCENARNHGFKRNDFEMVHPLQNLFEQPKTRSMSWTPGMTQREPTVAGNSSERYPERLPPISTIIDSITVDNYGYDRREPTVQTLSNLASFYNTHGHRYSYPGVHATQRQWRRPSWEDVRRPSMESTRSSGSIGWEHEFTYAPEKTSPRITDGAITDRFNERRPIPNDWRRPDQRNSREWRAQEGGS
ncbi:hypothetical protein LQ764DRAFT_219534 [Zygosaccharomyces rouxii]|nr:hypothetical protein LQ764DRAFT_219534 [Zygosaccharomyces rouxii]